MERFGKRDLTPREMQMASLVARGLTNKEIAAEMGLSFLYAKRLVSIVLDKTGMGNRVELAIWYAAKYPKL